MSQFDEDWHIEQILTEIGHGSKVLCDVGARFEGSNSARLIRRHGWTGTLVDANPESCKVLEHELPQAKVVNATVDPWNINDLFPKEAHFFSLDIDSHDWWVWANLLARPALVVVETNPAPGVYVARLGAGPHKRGTPYGMSVEAAKLLGELKGYDYVGRNVVNAFFVRKDMGCKYRLPAIKEHVGAPCSAAGNVFG